MKKCIPVGVGILMLAFTASHAAINVVSDFSTNPLTGGAWSFGVGDNSNNQFVWNQPTSSLHVHLDSSLPTVRLDLPIGGTLTTGTDFTLTSRFSFTINSAPDNEGMQLAFGLVNHTLTGGDRTGTSADFGSDNVFNTVEFDYFPNVSPAFGSGRTLAPAVFGAQNGGGDAFTNFKSIFGPGSDLGDNIDPAIDRLPQSTLLQATLNYTANTKMLTLTMQRVNGDLSLTTLETSVPPLNLSTFGPTFAVDSLAIMAYQDGFNGDPFQSPLVALVADMDIQQIGVASPAPEAASTLLLLSAGGVSGAVEKAARIARPAPVKKAFTLVELLVVIAIIAILGSLLLAVSSRAKTASARAISAHSLSQLIVAGHLYLKDNDNTFWPYQKAESGGVQWWFGFESSTSAQMPEGKRTCDYSKGPLGPYAIASGGIKTDPAFLEYSPRLKPKYQDGNYGYGYNIVLVADSTGAPRNSLQVEDPSQMIVFATCAQVNAFQAPASSKKPMIEEFYLISDTQRTAHFRHGRDALAAFLDGSVRPLSMDTDMQPGSQDGRIPSANIGVFKTSYVRQAGW